MSDIAASSTNNSASSSGERSQNKTQSSETDEQVAQMEEKTKNAQIGLTAAMLSDPTTLGGKVANGVKRAKDTVQNVQSAIKKAEFVAALISNPLFWIVVLIVICLIIIFIVYNKLNDTTGGSLKTFCDQIGASGCIRQVIDKGGEAVRNSI